MTPPQPIVDLRSAFGAPRDQGARPTCLALAASDLHAMLRAPWRALSSEFAFFHAQRRAQRKPSQGATLTATLESLRDDGQPVETAWPYLEKLPADLTQWTPPADVGAIYKGDGEPHLPSVNVIIDTLSKGRAALVTLKLSEAFYNVGRDGIVRAAENEAPDLTRRHAVVVVGHGLLGKVRALLIRNSWGVEWGDGGHAWLEEAYLQPRILRVATLKGLP